MEYILLDIRQNVAIIQINRPEKRNALNKATISELKNTLIGCLANSEIRGIILTGTGEKAFVAGADIQELNTLNYESAKAMATDNQENLFNLLSEAEKPIIACINGYALGGGLELAMACHIRYASENAQFGLPELSLGIIPGYGGTQRLTELIGKSRAIEMILTSETLSAQKALSNGLIDYITSPENLIPYALERLNLIINKSPLAVKAALKALSAYFHKTENGYIAEIEEFAKLTQTHDFKEGTQAFLEKRKPHFTGN